MTLPTNEDLIDSLSEAIIGVSRSTDREIFIFNQSAEKITELSRAKTIGAGLATIFKRDPWLIDMVNETLESGKSYTEYEEKLHRWFSDPLPVGVSTLQIFDPNGEISGAGIIIKDRSGIKSIEAETARKDRLAYLGTFAAKLAHEIRNPLSGIRGAAQLVDRRIEDKEVKEFSGLIISEVDRLSSIVKEMLNFTRPAKLKLKELNIHKLLSKVLMILSEGLKSKGVIEEYDPSIPDIVGDDEQLTQVFLNILKNAREAAGVDGQVRVVTKIVTDFHLSKDGGTGKKFAVISVIDNGPGIEPEVMDKIFTPFFTTKSGGSGLGMSISLSIVKEHGGFMKIDSTAEKGTTMQVYLPTSERGSAHRND